MVIGTIPVVVVVEQLSCVLVSWALKRLVVVVAAVVAAVVELLLVKAEPLGGKYGSC